MPLTVFFAAGPNLWPEYEGPLPAALKDAGIEARIVTEAPEDPASVD